MSDDLFLFQISRGWDVKCGVWGVSGFRSGESQNDLMIVVHALHPEFQVAVSAAVDLMDKIDGVLPD